jgi:DNA-binding beta-propeller fold protein YncE
VTQRLWKLALAMVCFAVGLTSVAGGEEADGRGVAPGYHVIRRVAMPDGWWDYASFDPVHRRLFVSRANGVFEMDVDTGKIDPQVIPGSEGRASALTPNGDRVIATMAGWGAAIVFDTNSGDVKKMFSLRQVPDAAVYDPATKLAWVMGRHGEATLLDVDALRDVGVVQIGGELEFAAVDGKGRLFVNDVENRQVTVVDTRKRTVSGHYKLRGCEEPTGLAYVARHDILISVCGNGLAKVLDAALGTELASLSVGEDADAVIVDAAHDLAFIPCAKDGTVAVLAVGGPRDVRVLETDRTQPGTRTGTLDPKTRLLYLPTARFGPKNKLGWSDPLPGSVELLVMAPGGADYSEANRSER